MFLSTGIDQNIRYHLSENSNAVVMLLLLYVSFSRTKLNKRSLENKQYDSEIFLFVSKYNKTMFYDGKLINSCSCLEFGTQSCNSGRNARQTCLT
jgi:hypothetical protein